MTGYNEVLTRGPFGESGRLSALAAHQASSNLRNAEVIEAMGMLGAVRQRWKRVHHDFVVQQNLGGERAAAVGAASRNVRLALQSLVLGFGAWLAIQHLITPGMMIAGSILMARVLAPIGQFIGVWLQWGRPTRACVRNFTRTRQERQACRCRARSVGWRPSLPLFAGGGVAASVRQARAHRDQLGFELDAQLRATVNQLRKQFNLCTSSKAKIRAYELGASTALVEATHKSVQGGERINLDVLNAQQQLYNARRDLAQAWYDYLRAWVLIRFVAGVLSADELHSLGRYFIVRG